MPRVLATPFCHAVMFGDWNESPRRRFAAYRCRGPLPRLLGQAVVDEFATLSSPVFFCRRELAGKIYDAGLTLAHRRGSELGIDAGWPPFVVAQDGALDEPVVAPVPELAADWQERLLAALQGSSNDRKQETPDPSTTFVTRRVGEDRLHWARLGDADVLVTDAPLLPRQLRRLCEGSRRSFALAVSEAQVLVPSDEGAVQALRAVSEERLTALTAATRAMLMESP